MSILTKDNLKTLANLLNMFHEDLGQQIESSATHAVVFRHTVSTLNRNGPGRPKYEVLEEYLCILNHLDLPEIPFQMSC